MTEKDYLRRQSGYYVYYARNEAMQNYMIEKKLVEERNEKSDIEQKDEEVLRNYRRIMGEKRRYGKTERMGRFAYGMLSGLTVAVLALGIGVFSNYKMLEKLEMKLIASGLSVDEESYGDYEVKVHKGNKTIARTEDEKKETAMSSVKKEKGTIDLPNYYVVQSGDTLSSISFKMYNSVGYVGELMEANGFGEADEIREGDRIVIPTVN